MVGDDDHVGVASGPAAFSASSGLREIVVGVADRGQRGRAVDAGHQRASGCRPDCAGVPSGSRDQNTSTNGLLRSLNSGSTALVATSAK